MRRTILIAMLFVLPLAGFLAQRGASSPAPAADGAVL